MVRHGPHSSAPAGAAHMIDLVRCILIRMSIAAGADIAVDVCDPSNPHCRLPTSRLHPQEFLPALLLLRVADNPLRG